MVDHRLRFTPTNEHSAQSSLAVTHPSTNWARRYLISVTESPSKHRLPLQTSNQGQAATESHEHAVTIKTACSISLEGDEENELSQKVSTEPCSILKTFSFGRAYELSL